MLLAQLLDTHVAVLLRQEVTAQHNLCGHDLTVLNTHTLQALLPVRVELARNLYARTAQHADLLGLIVHSREHAATHQTHHLRCRQVASLDKLELCFGSICSDRLIHHPLTKGSLIKVAGVVLELVEERLALCGVHAVKRVHEFVTNLLSLLTQVTDSVRNRDALHLREHLVRAVTVQVVSHLNLLAVAIHRKHLLHGVVKVDNLKLAVVVNKVGGVLIAVRLNRSTHFLCGAHLHLVNAVVGHELSKLVVSLRQTRHQRNDGVLNLHRAEHAVLTHDTGVVERLVRTQELVLHLHRQRLVVVQSRKHFLHLGGHVTVLKQDVAVHVERDVRLCVSNLHTTVLLPALQRRYVSTKVKLLVGHRDAHELFLRGHVSVRDRRRHHVLVTLLHVNGVTVVRLLKLVVRTCQCNTVRPVSNKTRDSHACRNCVELLTLHPLRQPFDCIREVTVITNHLGLSHQLVKENLGSCVDSFVVLSCRANLPEVLAASLLGSSELALHVSVNLVVTETTATAAQLHDLCRYDVTQSSHSPSLTCISSRVKDFKRNHVATACIRRRSDRPHRTNTFHTAHCGPPEGGPLSTVHVSVTNAVTLSQATDAQEPELRCCLWLEAGTVLKQHTSVGRSHHTRVSELVLAEALAPSLVSLTRLALDAIEPTSDKGRHLLAKHAGSLHVSKGRANSSPVVAFERRNHLAHLCTESLSSLLVLCIFQPFCGHHLVGADHKLHPLKQVVVCLRVSSHVKKLDSKSCRVQRAKPDARQELLKGSSNFAHRLTIGRLLQLISALDHLVSIEVSQSTRDAGLVVRRERTRERASHSRLKVSDLHFFGRRTAEAGKELSLDVLSLAHQTCSQQAKLRVHSTQVVQAVNHFLKRRSIGKPLREEGEIQVEVHTTRHSKERGMCGTTYELANQFEARVKLLQCLLLGFRVTKFFSGHGIHHRHLSSHDSLLQLGAILCSLPRDERGTLNNITNRSGQAVLRVHLLETVVVVLLVLRSTSSVHAFNETLHVLLRSSILGKVLNDCSTVSTHQALHVLDGSHVRVDKLHCSDSISRCPSHRAVKRNVQQGTRGLFPLARFLTVVTANVLLRCRSQSLEGIHAGVAKHVTVPDSIKQVRAQHTLQLFHYHSIRRPSDTGDGLHPAGSHVVHLARAVSELTTVNLLLQLHLAVAGEPVLKQGGQQLKQLTEETADRRLLLHAQTAGQHVLAEVLSQLLFQLLLRQVLSVQTLGVFKHLSAADRVEVQPRHSVERLVVLSTLDAEVGHQHGTLLKQSVSLNTVTLDDALNTAERNVRHVLGPPCVGNLHVNLGVLLGIVHSLRLLDRHPTLPPTSLVAFFLTLTRSQRLFRRASPRCLSLLLRLDLNTTDSSDSLNHLLLVGLLEPFHKSSTAYTTDASRLTGNACLRLVGVLVKQNLACVGRVVTRVAVVPCVCRSQRVRPSLHFTRGVNHRRVSKADVLGCKHTEVLPVERVLSFERQVKLACRTEGRVFFAHSLDCNVKRHVRDDSSEVVSPHASSGQQLSQRLGACNNTTVLVRRHDSVTAILSLHQSVRAKDVLGTTDMRLADVTRRQQSNQCISNLLTTHKLADSLARGLNPQELTVVADRQEQSTAAEPTHVGRVSTDLLVLSVRYDRVLILTVLLHNLTVLRARQGKGNTVVVHDLGLTRGVTRNLERRVEDKRTHCRVTESSVVSLDLYFHNGTLAFGSRSSAQDSLTQCVYRKSILEVSVLALLRHHLVLTRTDVTQARVSTEALRGNAVSTHRVEAVRASLQQLANRRHLTNLGVADVHRDAERVTCVRAVGVLALLALNLHNAVHLPHALNRALGQEGLELRALHCLRSLYAEGNLLGRLALQHVAHQLVLSHRLCVANLQRTLVSVHQQVVTVPVLHYLQASCKVSQQRAKRQAHSAGLDVGRRDVLIRRLRLVRSLLLKRNIASAKLTELSQQLVQNLIFSLSKSGVTRLYVLTHSGFLLSNPLNKSFDCLSVVSIRNVVRVWGVIIIRVRLVLILRNLEPVDLRLQLDRDGRHQSSVACYNRTQLLLGHLLSRVVRNIQGDDASIHNRQSGRQLSHDSVGADLTLVACGLLLVLTLAPLTDNLTSSQVR